MNYLLDTHTLNWFINGDKQLTVKAKELIQNIKNKCFVSIASIWEIAIKVSLGKLDINKGFDELSRLITKYEFEILPISFEHIRELLDLEFYHRDPFDRIILSQAKIEKIPVISCDKIFKLYPINLIWK
jgi:PIN domain nuclease of toxin-antitoxin system